MARGLMIVDGGSAGDWNMARDQVLLDWVQQHRQPVLRFYRWTPATLSLGYFQQASERNRHLGSQPLAWVRRSTGGGAIVHDNELTYSLCIPIKDRTSDTVRAIYDHVHGVIASVLSDMGAAVKRYGEAGYSALRRDDREAFLCFQRRTAEDLVLAGYKVVGSAQRRILGSLLQHGSILLGASRYAAELPGINNLVSRPVDIDSLELELARRLGDELALHWEPFPQGVEVLEPLIAAEEARFSSDLWRLKR